MKGDFSEEAPMNEAKHIFVIIKEIKEIFSERESKRCFQKSYCHLMFDRRR